MWHAWLHRTCHSCMWLVDKLSLDLLYLMNKLRNKDQKDIEKVILSSGNFNYQCLRATVQTKFQVDNVTTYNI